MDSLVQQGSGLLPDMGELPLDAFLDEMLCSLPHDASPGALQISCYPSLEALAPEFAPSWSGWLVDTKGLADMPAIAAQEELSLTPPANGSSGGDHSSSAPRKPQNSEGDDTVRLKDRVERMKAKNARNQKLFRQRAKEKAKRTEEDLREAQVRLRQLEAEKADLARRNKVLETAVACKAVPEPAALSKVPRHALELAGCETDPRRPFVITVREGTRQQVTFEQIQRLTWVEFAKLWKEFVNAMAMALVAVNGQTSGPAHDRLTTLVKESNHLCGALALGNMPIMYSFGLRRLDDSPVARAQQAPTMEVWAGILHGLQLSEAQKTTLLAQRRMHLATWAPLVREQGAIIGGLQTVTWGVTGETSATQCEFLRSLDLSQQLTANLEQIHRSMCLFMGHFYYKILTPVQAASFIVQAFPWAPDAVALTNCLAVEAGEPSTQEALAAM